MKAILLMLSYLNFVKGFDSINHRFIKPKMKSLGCGVVIVRWIEAYFTGPASIMQIGGELSEAIAMCSEVQQGSVVGSILLLLFASDLQDAPEAVSIRCGSYKWPVNWSRHQRSPALPVSS